MSLRILLTMIFTFVSTAVFAQSEAEISHHDVNYAVGAAVPTGSDTSYLNKAPMFLLSYGYRFNRFFQAEGGVQWAVGAANNQKLEQTQAGAVRGGDTEVMIPFSGRLIVPLPLERWEVSAGGGPAYLYYTENADLDRLHNCSTCTSRGGWGLQGSMKVRYLLGEHKKYHIGTTLQYVSGSLNGHAVGNIPATKTTDHWYNVLFEVGMRFD